MEDMTAMKGADNAQFSLYLGIPIKHCSSNDEYACIRLPTGRYRAFDISPCM